MSYTPWGGGGGGGGSVMWRSPEGQLAKGIGKPSEVFSFALLVSQLLV